MNISLASILAAAWLAFTPPVMAQTAQAANQVAYTEAEVRKVDKSAGKITLKHAEIKSLDMPPMTMVFGVKDASMLDQLKAGDKIRFRAVNDGGKFTVTEMQAAQ